MLVVGDSVEPVEHFDQVEGGPVGGGAFRRPPRAEVVAESGIRAADSALRYQ
jgi:hypothetical protein